MLNRFKSIKGYKLNGLDGEVGTVKEFFFDDRFWTIRYLVADTGNWLGEWQVLISPFALTAVNVEDKTVVVELTKKQIEESPSLASYKPVSRQYEEEYSNYYGWPMYWSGPYMWGLQPGLLPNREKWREPTQSKNSWDPHLRSTQDVMGHAIQTNDGKIGHVEDFIFDDETWAIRYFVVDTKNFGLGKLVLLSPRWIENIDWIQKKVIVALSRDSILGSPEFLQDSLLTGEYETDLHRHYNRHGYWIDELNAEEKHH